MKYEIQISCQGESILRTIEVEFVNDAIKIIGSDMERVYGQVDINSPIEQILFDTISSHEEDL